MSRTLSGNLTGRAARRTLDDALMGEGIYSNKKHIHTVCQEIRDRLGQEAYNKWWQDASEEHFNAEAETKLLQLKRDEYPDFGLKWIAANEYITDFVLGDIDYAAVVKGIEQLADYRPADWPFSEADEREWNTRREDGPR